jgi:predicted RNA-binding Zn ribbon-like protein
MVTPLAGDLSLVGGNVALDLANTLSGRKTTPFEHLHAAADVVDWALHAGVVDEVRARRAKAAFQADPEAAGRTMERALHLRDAIYGIAAAIAHGGTAPNRDLAALKDFVRKAIGSAELVPGNGGGYRFDFSAAPIEISLLGPIAWSALELLAAGHFDRLKQCANDTCGWLFLDHSKNNSRRWCDMATCGNRTKAKRHRQRQ